MLYNVREKNVRGDRAENSSGLRSGLAGALFYPRTVRNGHDQFKNGAYKCSRRTRIPFRVSPGPHLSLILVCRTCMHHFALIILPPGICTVHKCSGEKFSVVHKNVIHCSGEKCSVVNKNVQCINVQGENVRC